MQQLVAVGPAQPMANCHRNILHTETANFRFTENGTYSQSFAPNRLRGEQIGALFNSHSFCMIVVDVGSLEDLCGRKIGQSCSAIALGSSLGALQKRIHSNLSWSWQEQCVFEETFYGSTLEARRVWRGQSQQCRSVSFHRPPADASLQKQWLVTIPLTNTPTSSKRTPMSA